MSKAMDALEKLFESIEDEIGPAAGPKTCEALGNARQVISDSEKRKRKRAS